MSQQSGRRIFTSLSEREEWLGQQIVDAAYKVHKKLGPGLLERVYEACFCHELAKKGIKYQRQAELEIYYDEFLLDDKFRVDVLVDDLVICELKSVDVVNRVWPLQVISHLKISRRRLGYLINFNVEQIKDGIRRFVN
jgi:GxxExxY protein